VDDVLEVLDPLNAQKSLLVGTSCAGQILTMFASQHSDRLSGLVYLDGASDPTTPAYDPPMPDPTRLPRPIRPAPPPDRSSFEAFTQRRDLNVTFPEAEWHQQFAANPDGSVGRSLMNLGSYLRRSEGDEGEAAQGAASTDSERTEPGVLVG
jgi:pimeloyl-ACP methyl ester carboxylesterase